MTIVTNRSHKSRARDEWGRHRPDGGTVSEQSPPRGSTSLFALSSWPLRRKLALALAIPLVLAAALGGVRVAGDLNEADNSSASARQVTVLRPAIDYLTASSQAMVAAQRDSRANRRDVKAAVADLEAAAEDLESTRTSADLTPEQSNQVDVVLDLSRVLREESRTLSPGTWVAQLRQLQTGISRLITTIANAQLEPQPRLQLLAETLAGRFSLAMQQALVATSRSGETGSLELFAELGAEGAAIDRLASDLGQSEPVVSELLTDNARRTRTVRTGGADLGDAGAFAGYDKLVGSLLEDVDTELVASAHDARTRAMLGAGLTAGALLAAILLALLVSRVLLTPIHRVRQAALAVAHQHLPDAVARIRTGDEPAPITPIDVTTHEEVGQLARAVDDLHRQAVVLAAGEAGLRAQVSEMFVTLSRRNTSLVNQQLRLIDSLEKDEEDPARLQSLFRLDHLASRMRRTADSLLVLADAPMQQAGQQDLTVGEAMQAATAGVQDYQRVRVGGSLLGTRIGDEAASDVVHLLTELVDNALAYSPPSAQVAIESSRRPHGVSLEVVDGGLGVPDDILAELNERLRSGGAVTADATRRMGLFVVSRLSERHDIKVELRRNGQGGTTATVLLPESILPGLHAERPVPAPPAPYAEPFMRAPSPAGVTAETLTARPRLGSMLDGPPSPAPSAGPWAAPLAAAAERRGPVLEPAPKPLDPLVAPLSALDPARGEDDSDGPIFRSLRSAWLSVGGEAQPWTTSEVEAGWEVAERAVRAPVAQERTSSGLPVRRPGAHLVPGGVTKQTHKVARDPEAIKSRLAAHAAGVSRGRHAAATTPTGRTTAYHPHTEADPA
jgi:signal transduction histidine kinase